MTTRDRNILLGLALFIGAARAGVARAQPRPPPDLPPPEDGAAAVEPPASPTPPATIPAVVAEAASSAPVAPRFAIVQHIPAAEASTTGGSIELAVTYPELLGSLVVRWREPHARAAIHEIPVRRSASRWSAVLPPEALVPPGIEYWIVERPRAGIGASRAIFASAERPRFLGVWAPAADAHEQEALALRGGRRSTLSARGEYVQFGSRRLGAPCATGGEGGCSRWPDRYWHLEGSYAYSFFTHVEQIRLSVGTVRGDAANDRDASSYESGETYDTEIGIQYGRAEITWYLVDFVRARTSVLLGFSTEGFEYGGGAEIILGNDLATNIALGVEGTSTLGATGRLRLEWWTLPRLPMGASVEVTTFPTGSDAGVRLLYDVGYVLYPGAMLRVRGGYQGRTSVTGGPALGGEAAFAF